MQKKRGGPMRQAVSPEGAGRFMGRPEVSDVGMGALLFFASHMVIRTTYYVGLGRTEAQMSIFVLVVLGSIALTHLLWRFVLKVRLSATAYTGAPIVSVLAGAGAVLELMSMIPGKNDGYFFLGAAFVGASIGWFSTVIVSSIRPAAPLPHFFRVPWALVLACMFYFLFRIASSVSGDVGQGVLLALPLVTIACASSPSQAPRDADALIEGRRSLQVLVWVSAAFAVLGSIVVWVSQGEVPPVDSSVNYWTLLEVLAVVVLFGSCYVLYKLSCQKVFPRHTPAFVAILCLCPAFFVGGATAAVFAPASNGSLMWEFSFWVLIVAVFAYDMKATPYSIDGLGLGIMFESMCVGQMVVRLAQTPDVPFWVPAAGVLFALMYLCGVATQLRSAAKPTGVLPVDESAAGGVPHGLKEAGATDGCPAARPSVYGAVALRFGLTEREERILELVGEGRSASYISDALGISFNTVRTHIRHVYEKMGVHSKQELIDLVKGE